jgi:hypothetical protein
MHCMQGQHDLYSGAGLLGASRTSAHLCGADIVSHPHPHPHLCAAAVVPSSVVQNEIHGVAPNRQRHIRRGWLMHNLLTKYQRHSPQLISHRQRIGYQLLPWGRS